MGMVIHIVAYYEDYNFKYGDYISDLQWTLNICDFEPAFPPWLLYFLGKLEFSIGLHGYHVFLPL